MARRKKNHPMWSPAGGRFKVRVERTFERIGKKLGIDSVSSSEIKKVSKTVQQNLKRLERMAKRAAKRVLGHGRE